MCYFILVPLNFIYSFIFPLSGTRGNRQSNQDQVRGENTSEETNCEGKESKIRFH